MITYLGVQFFSFGMKYGFDYSMEYFKKMFFENERNTSGIKFETMEQ